MLPQSTTQPRHPPQLRFNYLSPQHITTVLFSPKHKPHKFNQPIEHQCPPQHPPAFLSFKKIAIEDNELDITQDSLDRTPTKQEQPQFHKKMLCQSVIISQNNNHLVNNRQDIDSSLAEYQSKNGRNNPMKRSCMPGLLSQGSFNQKWKLQYQNKQNCQFLKFTKPDKIPKTFNFSKNKMLPKKNTSKLSNAKIEDFQVGSMLGKGSIGKVYLARHIATNCYYALKKILKSQIKDLDQFCRGVKCHLFLNHPHITQIYACFCDQLHFYMLMELSVDGNLAKYKKTIKHEQEKKKIVHGTTKGVQHMHKNLIRHGDIKLENILISFGTPKITDLDCAIVGNKPDFQHQVAQDQLLGSPAYFSPQMITHHTLTISDDIWALGVIIYQIYCKGHPFNLIGSEDLFKIPKKQLSLLPQSLPPFAKLAIASSLSKEPVKRCSLDQLLQYFQPSSPERAPKQ